MLASAEGTMRTRTRPTPEELLLARCRAGDREAFGQIYVQHERLIFRYAYRLVGHREDAHDIRQETFVQAYRAIGAFRSQCSLQTWLLKICTNLCRNHVRSRRYRCEITYGQLGDGQMDQDHLGPHAALWGSAQTLDPQVELEQAADTEVITRAIGALTPAQRELIILREYEDLSSREIAQIFGCAEATVRVKLFRARKMLKEKVEALLEAR